MATIGRFGLCVLPAYVARNAPDLVAVLPDEISLRRSYWMIAHANMAETAQVRLTQRFVYKLMTEAGAFFA